MVKFHRILMFCLPAIVLLYSCVKSSDEPMELSLDLVDLQAKNKFENSRVISVSQDPVYHKAKKYQGVSAVDLIKNQIDLTAIDIKNTKIVFECKDGYRPEMPLQLFLRAEPYIAFRDLDAPKGSRFELIYKNGQQMDAEPFYLVYTAAPTDNPQYKWPYNLIKIILQPLLDNEQNMLPAKLDAGKKLFQTYCISCHALNGKGGSMGPELNYPKSVTQYWKEKELVDYIVDPAAFRNKVKMPSPGVTKEESQQIVDYLKYMSNHKNN